MIRYVRWSRESLIGVEVLYIDGNGREHRVPADDPTIVQWMALGNVPGPPDVMHPRGEHRESGKIAKEPLVMTDRGNKLEGWDTDERSRD